MIGILPVLQAVIGGIVLFSVLGWLLIQRLFPKVMILEKIVYSITSSIALSVIIGAILGFFGIFSFVTLIIGYGMVAVIIIIIGFFI